MSGNDSTLASGRDATPLSGGVSCEVELVRDANGREMVVKQPLEKLKVAADWRSNPQRYEVEVRALRTLRELLGDDAVPAVLWVDDQNKKFAMERIDPRFRNWKLDLLQGRIDLTTASRVGELLGIMHSRSANRADIAASFRNRVYFEELRLEPFFERVAKRNLALSDGIADAIADLRAPGIALVHGDFSPKNLLVDGAKVVVLDLEIAHWGNPRFDVAFCLSHLLLKGLRRGVDAKRYADAARTFVGAYRGSGMKDIFDASLVRILGCLMLARFDGASPVDYLGEVDADRARLLASALIHSPGADLSSAAIDMLG